MTSLIGEFRAIPWNARGRRVGRIIAGTVMVLLLTSPAWIEGMVFKAIGR